MGKEGNVMLGFWGPDHANHLTMYSTDPITVFRTKNVLLTVNLNCLLAIIAYFKM